MFKVEKLVIATRNLGKVDYYRHIFIGAVDQVLGLADLDIQDKPTETGDSAEENAEIKARFYSTKTHLPIFCEDEALYADFLPSDQQPGTHVRRINGVDEVSDDQLLIYWENLIKNVPANQRTGHWHIAYSLAFKGRIKTVSRDFPIMFFYPSSQIRIPGWPMSSLEGSVKFKKPNSNRTKEEISINQIEEAPIILEKLKELLRT